MRSQWPPKKVRQRCASAAVMFSMYADEWFSWLGRQTGWCIQTLPCVQQSNPTLFQRKVRNCSFVTSLRKVANVQASHCSGLCVSLFVCLFVCLHQFQHIIQYPREVPRTQMTHILEDSTHKIEGQPPKKEVSWGLGIHIYFHKSVEHLKNTTSFLSWMKPMVEGQGKTSTKTSS